MTDTSTETIVKWILCIWYLVQFCQKSNEYKNKDVRVLIDSGNKIIIIHPNYSTKLGLHTRKIDLSAQKIDRSHLDTFRIVIADYSVKNKLGKVRFFQEIFLLANIGLELVLEMFFLTFSRVDVWFAEWEFVWRTYIATKALPTTRGVKIINKKEFAVVILNVNNKIFVVYVAALVEPISILIYLFYQVQVALLISEETEIPTEYSNFSNVFSSDSAVKLPEHIGINDNPINLLDNKQPLYSLIYSLGPVDVETLKIYIEVNLAGSFIRPSKSPASTPILFVQKKNNSLCLCINHQVFNNLIIKNCYLLSLISESLNCLGHIKHFT